MDMFQSKRKKLLRKECHSGKERLVLTSLLKENKNVSYEVVVRCPHCQQRLMDAEYVVARIKCPRYKNQVALKVENK
jgi:hypothetical protein